MAVKPKSGGVPFLVLDIPVGNFFEVKVLFDFTSSGVASVNFTLDMFRAYKFLGTRLPGETVTYNGL